MTVKERKENATLHAKYSNSESAQPHTLFSWDDSLNTELEHVVRGPGLRPGARSMKPD